MKYKVLEKTEVLEPCKKLCKKLKMQGYILKWRRLDALDYYHEPGDPDLEIWIKRGNCLCIIMAECKYGKGKLRPSQVSCMDKYSGFKNVFYTIIDDVNKLQSLILGLDDNIYLNQELFNEFKNL